MEESFDPYRKWLGIPRREQPPHHYRLLGINAFENDPDVIDAAADRQMAHIRTYQSGQHAEESQKILNELSAARVCLLDVAKRTAYNAELRASLTAKGPEEQPGETPFGHLAVGAAGYLVAQLRRFWLVRVRLAAAYRELGQDVHHEGRYRDRLEKHYGKLEKVARRLESLQQSEETKADDEPKRITFATRVNNLVGRFFTFLRRIIFGRRRRALFRNLGRAAYELDREASGPEELTTPVREGLQRLEQLRATIAELSEIPPGEMLSPKRLAWIGVAIVVLVILFFLGVRIVL